MLTLIMEDYYKRPFTKFEVDDLLNSGEAIDATNGGLILGPSHSSGGIYFLVHDSQSDLYLLEGELEGYEFILNTGATYYYSKILKTLNNPDEHVKGEFEGYNPDSFIEVIDIYTYPDFKYLIFRYSGFSIINKFSTKGFLKSLNVINQSLSFIISGNTIDFTFHNKNDIPLFFYDEKIGYLPRRGA